jgi:hypothetical protein
VHANHYHDADCWSFRAEAGENSLAREGMLDGYLRERMGES